ncbi:MAG TPA: hypothetical protein VMI33_01070 [Streptosporangiaceae bacterium]|nr:hypothetical protein [Streptosporangiaceae bacterium]
MSVVRRQARRRWLVVACGTALLCGLPAIVAALPVPNSPLSAAALRARVLASAGAPYQGYAESSIDLGLPALPDLGDVSTLLDGITDQEAWYLSPSQWRADVVTSAGETDTYQTIAGIFAWSYSQNLLTQIVGPEPVRLPRAADLLPPALARRLLGLASPADRLSRLPSQRVAGVAAAGLRLVPDEPSTTVAAVDIWADPASGLPVQVEIVGRGSAKPVLVARFLELTQSRPALATVTPDPAPDVGFTTTELPDINRIVNGFAPPLPARIAGMSQVPVPGGLADVAAYGTGFSRVAVLPLPFAVGERAMTAADDAGAGGIILANGTGALIATPLLTVLLAQGEPGSPVYLLAGTVTPALLVRAGSGLLNAAGQGGP